MPAQTVKSAINQSATERTSFIATLSDTTSSDHTIGRAASRPISRITSRPISQPINHTANQSTMHAAHQLETPTASRFTIRACVIHAMTIPFTVQIATTTADKADLLLAEVTPQITKHLHDVERRFSPFRADSLVSKARQGDWTALPTEPDFAEVYALCQQAKRLTEDAFNPMHAGAYDPTGLVKGWAIQRAYEQFLQPLLHDGRCEAAAISGGGDIQTGVRSNSDFKWRIGVENPLFASNKPHNAAAYSSGVSLATSTLRTITLHNGAIATSGTHKRGEHITRTDHSLAQATIVADQLIFADMWATTAISVGETRLRALIERANGFNGMDHIMAVLVRTDYSIAELP